MIINEIEKLGEFIKALEAFEPNVYQCTEGKDTIGYGFLVKNLKELNIDTRKPMFEPFAASLVIYFLQEIDKSMNDYDWYNEAPLCIREAVLNMCYQMGIDGFMKFGISIMMLKQKNYTGFTEEILDSKWGRWQTPERALIVSQRAYWGIINTWDIKKKKEKH